MKRFYEIKNVFSSDFDGSMIKDVDMKSRTVTGYFSRFGNIDHDGDMLMPGAFSKTVKERGFEGKNIIPHLLDHEMETLKQLSKPKIYEKSDGGFFESTISDTNNGIDTLKLYRDGVINQHSFGFRVLRKEDKKDYRAITETLLYEVSTVVLGANESTPFTGFKSLTAEELITVRPKVIERYNVLMKAFRDGDYTEDIFPILEAQIKQLEQEMVELFLKEQSIEQPQGDTIKEHDTQTTAPTVTTVTLPEVEVLKAEKLNNIINKVNKVTDYGKLRKIGESCGKL